MCCILHSSHCPFEKKDEFILQQSERGQGGDEGRESSSFEKSLTELEAYLVLQKEEWKGMWLLAINTPMDEHQGKIRMN